MPTPIPSATDGLDDAGWRQLSDATDAFEAVWRDAPPADLRDFIATDLGPLRRVVLIELIKLDLDYRWRRGERRLMEAYWADWPELRQHDDGVLELLHAEAQVRLRFSGSPATLTEFRLRFPTLAERIDSQLVELPEPPTSTPQAELSSHHIADSDTWTEQNADPGERECVSPTTRFASSESEGESAGGLTPLRSPNLSRRLGRYDLRETLGAGGMGTVYRAHDTTLGRDVALKVSQFDMRFDAVARERFLREARVAASIQHPHVCRVLDVGQTDGTFFMAMDLIAGQSLAKFIERQPVSMREAAEIVVKLAQAVAEIHAAGILHRDITASNVLLRTGNDPVLTDFGLARDLLDERNLTSSGSFLGTPAYLSPEVVAGGATKADARSDIYGVGVVLFQLLTGRLPFTGPLTKVLIAIEHSEPPTPRSLRPDVDADLEAICLKTIAKSPEKRFQSANELAEALDQWLRRLGTPARPLRVDGETPQTRTGKSAHPTRRSRRPVLLFAAAAMFLLVASAAIYVNTGEGQLELNVAISRTGYTTTLMARRASHFIRMDRNSRRPGFRSAHQ